jgi:hypothetical protein
LQFTAQSLNEPGTARGIAPGVETCEEIKMINNMAE